MSNLYIYLLTPCRNAAATLADTLKSVLTQTGDFFCHYHVQDGASKDGTQAVLEAFAERFARDGRFRFSWSSEPDTGMYAAINNGFDALAPLADEAFMGWINADDRLAERCFQVLGQIAGEKDAWVCGRNCKTGQTESVLRHYPQNVLAAGLCDGRYWNFVQQEGTFWKASLWKKVGSVDAAFRLAGDWDLWRRMASVAPLVTVDAVLATFSVREGQLSADNAAYYREIDEVMQGHWGRAVWNLVTGLFSDNFFASRCWAPDGKGVRMAPMPFVTQVGRVVHCLCRLAHADALERGLFAMERGIRKWRTREY